MSVIKFYKKFISCRKIINLNKAIFEKEKVKKNNQVLIEFNNFCADHVALSYCANILKKKHNANIVAYPGHLLLSYPLKLTLFRKIKFNLGKFLGLNFFGVYKSFGTEKFFYPTSNNQIIENTNKSFKYFNKKVKNLVDLENFKLKKILIGDLLYDTFLKKQYLIKPTINLKSEKFLNFVYDFLTLFEIWHDYLKNKKVKAIISSHPVYVMGMILRIGKMNNIENYVLTYEQLWKTNNKQPRLYYEVNNFNKIFKNLSNQNKSKLIKISKKKIKKRLSGYYSADYGWITKSPFGYGNKINIKKANKNIFVIATHDFVDSPHALGNALFPDFYQWLIFLCKLSKQTNDIWLVKNHPNFGNEYSPYMKYERDVTNNAVKKYNNIKVLDKNTTLNDLVKIKVDAIFTVSGTIGVDGALLNIPVINASKNNPHINYNFNIHPKNIKQLKDIILNFKKYKNKLKIDRNEIYEFYGMRNVFFSKNWFFNDLTKTSKEIGGFHNFHKSTFYDYWIKNFNKFNEKKIKTDLEKYFYSKNIFLLNNKNLGNY